VVTEQKILRKLEAVQQSKKEFSLIEGSVQLDFFHVQYPQASGGKKKKHPPLDKEKFKKSK
jgi:hypothetical protein